MPKNSAQLTPEKAIGLAYVRRVKRLHKVLCELAELEVPVDVITPEDLILLEDNGFLFDFDSGLVQDLQRPEGATI